MQSEGEGPSETLWMRAGPLLPIRVLALSQDVPPFTQCQDKGSTPGTAFPRPRPHPALFFYSRGLHIHFSMFSEKKPLSHQGFRATPVWGVLR